MTGCGRGRYSDSPELLIFFFFFFSSRRRHTRLQGDWSSDVCSSDLWIAHFHTGGVPHRHELDGTQEVQWDGVMRGIAATNYRGYVAHEFVPTHDPLTSLRQAVDLCDV